MGLFKPKTGIDTSDATATAADILKDKTAYARSLKIIGQAVAGMKVTAKEITVSTTGHTFAITNLEKTPVNFILKTRKIDSAKVAEIYYFPDLGINRILRYNSGWHYNAEASVTIGTNSITITNTSNTHSYQFEAGDIYDLYLFE